MNSQAFDVVIIGAGPAGSVAGSMLANKGWNILVVEKEHFPRFSIGESLLPQCMAYLDDAGLSDALHHYADSCGFQFKNGAAFSKQGAATAFNFTDKFSAGPGTTYQVKRAAFDQLLAEGAAQKGVTVRFGHQVVSVSPDAMEPSLQILDEQGETYQVSCRFILDASGFGRVLPRFLQLDKVSSQPTRKAVFTHIKDAIVDETFDRNKILITVHPQFEDIWYWLIPFSDGTCSLGVVGLPEQIQSEAGLLTCLQQRVAETPELATLLANAEWHQEARVIQGYSASVEKMHGEGFALLGNAGEFLDPVFSSGVTIAIHSAWLISPLLDQYLRGEHVDFDAQFAHPLQQGINCFRTYVNAWYTGQFQTVIFAANQDPKIRAMISSILAGYAWDTDNPYVAQSDRRFNVLHELCAEQSLQS